MSGNIRRPSGRTRPSPARRVAPVAPLHRSSAGHRPYRRSSFDLRKISGKQLFVDAREFLKIGKTHALVDLVHGRAGKAELGHRTVLTNETRIRRAASRGKFRSL